MSIVTTKYRTLSWNRCIPQRQDCRLCLKCIRQGQDVLVYINTCIPYTFKTCKAFETFPFGASRRPGCQYIISSLNV